MNTLQAAIVENELTALIKDYCETLELDLPKTIDSDFIPGNFIKSQVLLTAICDIAVILNVEIPNNCYVFFEKNQRRQLSIKETVQKILEVAISEN